METEKQMTIKEILEDNLVDFLGQQTNIISDETEAKLKEFVQSRAEHIKVDILDLVYDTVYDTVYDAIK